MIKEVTDIKNLTTAERDALSASNGTLIYNSSNDQFERYDGSLWVGLVGLWPTSQGFRIVTSTPFTVTSNDYIVGVDLTIAGSSSGTLPEGREGQVLVVKDAKGDSSTNNITITTSGSDLFENGTNTTVINYPFGSWSFLFHIGKWWGIAFT